MKFSLASMGIVAGKNLTLGVFMSNRRDVQFLYNPHNRATMLDCGFIVNPQNNKGITNLNGSGRIASVYMHTSVTPFASNPNPIAGYIVVNFADNYTRYLTGWAEFSAPLDISVTSVVVGHAYTIASLGTATLAQWQTAGLAASIVPAVGASFIAAVTGTIGGSATVGAPLGSGCDHVELLGTSGVMNAGYPISGSQSNGGMQQIFACYAGGVITAPAPMSKIKMGFYMNNSAQGV